MIEEARLFHLGRTVETPWAAEIHRFFNTPKGTSELRASPKSLPQIGALLEPWQAPTRSIETSEIEGLFAEASVAAERREATSLTGSALEAAIERNALRSASRGFFFVGREPTDSGLPSEPEHILALAPKGTHAQSYDLNSVHWATKRARYIWLGYKYRESRSIARHELQRPAVPSEKFGQLLRNSVADQLIADVAALLADKSGLLAYRRKYLQPLERDRYGWVEDVVQLFAVPPRWILAQLQAGLLASPGPAYSLDDTPQEYRSYLSARVEQLRSI